MSETTIDPSVNYFHTLYRVARAVNSSLDVMQILPVIVEDTVAAVGVKAASLRLLSPDGKRLFVGAACGLSSGYRAKGPVDLERSEVDRLALAAATPIYIENACSDSRIQYPEQMHQEGVVSLLVAPLRVQDRPIGVLRVYSQVQRAFSPDEVELVEAIASLSALAIENGRLYERLNRNYQAALAFQERIFD